MKDVQGIELELGQRVTFSVGTALKIGIVERIRLANRYNRQFEVARIRLSEPIRRYERGEYIWDAANIDGGGWTFIQGAEKAPVLWKEICQENRICICPEVVKEDLTNAENSVE